MTARGGSPQPPLRTDPLWEPSRHSPPPRPAQDMPTRLPEYRVSLFPIKQSNQQILAGSDAMRDVALA